MGTGIDGQGLGSMMGAGGKKRGKFVRDRWERTTRNSSVVGISSSRVNEVSSFQVRLLVDYCWGTKVSSSSLSEQKKSDDGWLLGVLDGDLGYEGSCQLELFEVEMVVVHDGMTLIGKLDLLLHSVLGKEQVQPLRSRV